MADPIPPRWTYRFANYRRAFVLLREAIAISEQRELTQLEKEGVIQRFEYTWELAWKTLKDLLEAEGVDLPTITPAATIKAALAARLIDRGDGWMRTLDARNKMAHTYNFAAFETVVADIHAEYLALFDDLHERLLARLSCA